MKYRSTKEILETPIEQQIEDVFVQLFGEVLGKELFADYKTNPLYAVRYQEQMRLAKVHQDRIREFEEQKPKTQSLVTAILLPSAIIAACFAAVALLCYFLAK